MVIIRRRGTVVDAIREALIAAVHFADVAPAPGRPTVLRIEGPGALSGAAERAVVGHERALARSGFRAVECLGVDPTDERGRPGRLLSAVPAPGGAWRWERTSGPELQARIIRGDEIAPPIPSRDPPSRPRVLAGGEAGASEAQAPAGAAVVVPLAAARRRKR